MNLHHLELFYYVGKFGGISEAVRNMPYGIQQPAISAQLAQLEETLGVALFVRRPFSLTQQGEELFAFINPFFSNLDAVAHKLREGVLHHVRIGASDMVLRDHLPSVIDILRQKLPGLRITLRDGYQPQLENWLKSKELDLAITLYDPKSISGFNALQLLEVPLILLVPKQFKVKSVDQLWNQKRISEPLISLPPHDLIVRTFFEKLNQMGLEWHVGMEVSSLALVESYVTGGHGIGLSVRAPNQKPPPKVRALELDGFPPVHLGVLWQGTLTPALETCLQEIRERALLVAAQRAAQM